MDIQAQVEEILADHAKLAELQKQVTVLQLELSRKEKDFCIQNEKLVAKPLLAKTSNGFVLIQIDEEWWEVRKPLKIQSLCTIEELISDVQGNSTGEQESDTEEEELIQL